jgi:hypothetical protein
LSDHFRVFHIAFLFAGRTYLRFCSFADPSAYLAMSSLQIIVRKKCIARLLRSQIFVTALATNILSSAFAVYCTTLMHNLEMVV